MTQHLIEARSEAKLEQELLELLRVELGADGAGFEPRQGQPGSALLSLSARFAGWVDRAVARFDERARLAFLDRIGERRLPAQAATVPLSFILGDGAPAEVLVPAGTTVQAKPLPSARPAAPIEFSTRQAFTAARAALTAVYSVNPTTDEYGDHTARMATGFAFFDDMVPVEHALYLGHATLFQFAASGAADTHQQVQVQFEFQGSRTLRVTQDLRIVWEYASIAGWMPLDPITGEGSVDSVGFFGGQGALLRKRFGPAATKQGLLGHEMYWIRARLLDPLPEGGLDGNGALPVVDRVRVSLVDRRTALPLDRAFAIREPLDLSKTFRPFGAAPVTGDAFYFTCREAFSRPGAEIRLDIKTAEVTAAGAPTVRWQYPTRAGWHDIWESDAPQKVFWTSTTLTFVAPADWAEVEVNGEAGYWLRVYLAKRDFGLPTLLSPPEGAKKDYTATANATIPQIASITVSFDLLSTPTAPEAVVSSNDFSLEDVTLAARSWGQSFAPFKPSRESDAAIYFAFDRLLPAGRLSLYAAVDSELESPVQSTSPFTWEYLTGEDWIELGVDDRTLGFQRNGTIQFVGPWNAVPSPGVAGDRLYRVRARTKLGRTAAPLPIRGLYWNTVMASEQRSFERLQIARSSGLPRQGFWLAPPGTNAESTEAPRALAQASATSNLVPVLEGERLEVREWGGQREGGLHQFDDVPGEDLRVERDSRTGEITVWVRWRPVAALVAASADDRVYSIDRAAGVLRFGDDVHGRVPPVAAPILLTFAAGGRADANVPQGHVTELQSPLAFIDAVTNPQSASGGAPHETLDRVLRRGPSRVRHRGRAVTASDFEWLALEASPAVARARCLPTTGLGGPGQPGAVTVVIVPYGADDTPEPSDELRRRVRAYLSARAVATAANGVRVEGPLYHPVSVAVEVVPLTDADPAALDARLRARLSTFLHPLGGGPRGNGWAMGEPLYLSQVARLVEETEGVDHARLLRLRVRGGEQGERIDVPPNALVAAGYHEIKVSFDSGGC